MKLSRPVIMAILFFAAIMAVIVYSTATLAQHRVEACINFNGRTNCRTASGSTEEFAIRTARTNACAELASGVTESMQCENTPPTKLTVLK